MSIHVRSSDIVTPNNFKHETLSTGIPEMWIGSKRDNLYFRKDTTISLHFFEFNSIPRFAAKFEMSLTTLGSKLGEHRGVVSKTDESSTNFIRPCHSTKREFIKIINSKGPNLVP